MAGFCLELEPLDIPAIMRRADNAMYRAKTAGENQTVFTD